VLTTLSKRLMLASPLVGCSGMLGDISGIWLAIPLGFRGFAASAQVVDR
jgi:hypothetical protein